MNAKERFQAAAAIFLRAQAIPKEHLDAFLDMNCAGDDELRADALRMLDASRNPSVFGSLAGQLRPMHDGMRGQLTALGAMPTLPIERAGSTSQEAPGQVMGHYELVELIGEGGFGRVWIAEQHEPVRRRVALKIIKAGMDTREILARFELERQTLAVMDHPSVARVFDAGETELGRPYFVMEYVPGPAITKFCDQGRLRLEDRLTLFISVCDAVHHAHQKGIIHRDLKPSNILVAVVDTRPLPKVIDFGIAKAAVASNDDRTVYTEMGRMMGTPEYMSPEQASGGTDIDTRSDVYSLGVVLYQLLTGSLPFDGRMLRSAGVDGIARIIREVDPPKPSTRLSRPDAEAEDHKRSTPTRADETAELQQTDTRSLSRALRGELDWIVMRCLEKDRTRRYGSASEFAADLRRFLAGEPVVAAPPSRTYRVKKLVRRHRAPVIGASAAALALLVGAAGFAWKAIEARGQRDRALTAEHETSERADELQKVSDFQDAMLRQIDAGIAGGRLTKDVLARLDAALTKAGVSDVEKSARAEAFSADWTRVNATDAARELIDQTILKPAVAAIDKEFNDQPLVAAKLRLALGNRYAVLGLYDTAMELTNWALDTQRRLLGDEDPKTLSTIKGLANVLQSSGKAAEAERLLRDALPKFRRVFGNDTPDTLYAINSLAVALLHLGKLSESEALSREALDKGRIVLGDDHKETRIFLSNLGSTLREQGKYAEAEPYFREAYEKNTKLLGEDDHVTLVSMGNYAGILGQLGKLDEAERLFRQGLEARRRVMGENHPYTLAGLQSLGNTLMNRNKLAEAETLLRETLEKRRLVLGDENPDTLSTISTLTTVLRRRGDLDEAEPLMREAMETSRRVLGNENRDTLQSISNLATMLMETARFAEAEALAREGLRGRRSLLGNEHPSTLVSLNILGMTLARQQKFSEAETCYSELLQTGRRVLPRVGPDLLTYTNNMASLLREEGKLGEAEPLYRDALDAAEDTFGPDHPNTLLIHQNLAGVIGMQGRFLEAKEMLAPMEAKIRGAFTGGNMRVVSLYLLKLGTAHAGLEEFDEAETRLLEAHTILSAVRGATKKDMQECTRAIAEMYGAREKKEPDNDWASKQAEWSGKLAGLDADEAK